MYKFILLSSLLLFFFSQNAFSENTRVEAFGLLLGSKFSKSNVKKIVNSVNKDGKDLTIYTVIPKKPNHLFEKYVVTVGNNTEEILRIDATADSCVMGEIFDALELKYGKSEKPQSTKYRRKLNNNQIGIWGGCPKGTTRLSYMNMIGFKRNSAASEKSVGL